MSTARIYNRPLALSSRIVILLVIAIAGLLYVKWMPYYGKAFQAASTHSIGKSILMGDARQAPAVSWRSALDFALAYGRAIWKAMLLGLLLGAALQEFAPRAWIARQMGQSDMRSVAFGGLLAIPGMMCTCCAAPVVIGLRRANASAGAAVAFWLSNTVLNPAALVFMGFVLGWNWVGLRIALGVPLVFGTGYLINHLARSGDMALLRRRVSEAIAESAPQSASVKGWLTRFARLVWGLIPEYVILVLVLGAGRAWLFPTVGPGVGNELQWIVIMAAAGLLFVIPTAGEVPIVQALLALGVGAGPAAALMMTLPPISPPSLAMTGQVFTVRLLAVVSAVVLVTGVIAGLIAVHFHF
jgi:uncharacterized membrane protein YraQ (UPF0718 family)